MIAIKELKQWLDRLPDDGAAYIDDCGLCLRCLERPLAYLEVGGHPDEELEEDPLWPIR